MIGAKSVSLREIRVSKGPMLWSIDGVSAVRGTVLVCRLGYARVRMGVMVPVAAALETNIFHHRGYRQGRQTNFRPLCLHLVGIAILACEIHHCRIDTSSSAIHRA